LYTVIFMNTLSQLAESLIGSEIVKLGNAISERIRRGEKIYNYTIGDFDPKIFPIPAELKQGIHDAYDAGFTNYPPGDGIADLKKAALAFAKEYQGLDYGMDEVLIASGGRPLIYSLFKTLVDRGDKVLYAVPSWNNNHYVHMNDGAHCVIETLPENNFMPTAEDLSGCLSEAVLLCLCTPQNPTGTTLSSEALEQICDLVLEENKSRSESRKLYVMFDQMYGLLTYGSVKHHNPVSLRPEMKDFTIFIDGISKSFAATGVRVGWSFGPARVIAKMKALLSHIGAWAPMAEQHGVAHYLGQGAAVSGYLKAFKSGLEQRLRMIYEGIIALKSMGHRVDAVAPQAAIYLTIMFDLTGMKTAEGQTLHTQDDVTAYLLSEAKLAVVPFYAFGAERNSPWYRLSVGTAKLEDIPEMLGMLEGALERIAASPLK
jgi:aspartate aminotransferase